MGLVDELNKIAAEEFQPKWFWVCKFCGMKSQYGKWMEKHIESHCKKMICDEMSEDEILDHYLLPGEWEDHTVTVEPTMSAVYAVRQWLGLPLRPRGG